MHPIRFGAVYALNLTRTTPATELPVYLTRTPEETARMKREQELEQPEPQPPTAPKDSDEYKLQELGYAERMFYRRATLERQISYWKDIQANAEEAYISCALHEIPACEDWQVIRAGAERKLYLLTGEDGTRMHNEIDGLYGKFPPSYDPAKDKEHNQKRAAAIQDIRDALAQKAKETLNVAYSMIPDTKRWQDGYVAVITPDQLPL